MKVALGSTTTSLVGLFALVPSLVSAQSSTCGPAPSNGIRPSIASGYTYQVVATGLAKPRGLILDQQGNLLVVEADRGVISSHEIVEENGCVSIGRSSDITNQLELNHGIELSADGRTLYGSSEDNLYSWTYDGAARSTSDQTIHINNMTGSDHSTRTLLLSQQVPGMIVVSKGSLSNIDILATDINTGSSQVKAFNLTNSTSPYDYNTEGLVLGWGLRNEVGIGEHPNSGGIWGVENSADQMNRMGVDIHEDNPAEKLNFLGYLNGTSSQNQGGNFGYPWCFAAWEVDDLPDNGNLSVGSQFAIDASPASNNENRTDAFCAEQVAPRLVFQAHMAPMDIKFNNSGREAWVTFRGSWNRDEPVGYKLSVVAFTEGGEPVDEPDSMTAATDIFANEDLSRCPGNCMRLVGMAIDSQGRIFVASDASGEIYLVSRTDNSDTPAGSPTSSASASATGNAGHSILPPASADSLGLVTSLLGLLLYWI